jgi:hypothetical protein
LLRLATLKALNGDYKEQTHTPGKITVVNCEVGIRGDRRMTQTIYLNGHPELCGQDTFILYIQQHSGNQFKLGKGGGESAYHGKTPLEAIRDGRYGGAVAYQYPIIFVLSREYACQLMGKEHTAEMKHGNEMPKLDDWVRKRLGKPWGHNLGVRGAKKLGLDTEALIGHELKLNDRLIARVKEVLKLSADVGRLEPKLRESQVAIDAAICAAFSAHNRVALIAYGGFGKSYLALRNASYLWQKQGMGYVLILTNVIDNIDDFRQASEKFQFLGRRVQFMELNQLTAAKFHKQVAECKANGWIPVIAASTQNISGNTTGEDESEEDVEKVLKKLDTKFSFLHDAPLAALLQDEVHTHFAAKKTAEALHKLKPTYILDMTATMGRREMMTFGYSAGQIVSYSMLEALAAKRAGTDPDMATMPELDFEVFRNLVLPKEKLEEIGASVEEGWCSAKAFTLENGKLKYQRWALQIVQMTYALNVEFKAWKHAVTSVQNTGVHMMILPRGSVSEGSAADKCRVMVAAINAKFGDEVHAIDAYELRALANRAGATLAEQVAKEIELHPNRKILIITHRVLLTGVNIPQLETIALFDRIGSSKLFMQTAYRLFRKHQYSDGSWKERAKFVVFEPNVAIADTSAEGAIGGLLNDVRDKGEQKVRELYDLIHLTVYNGAEKVKLSAGELLEAHDAAVKAEWLEKHAKVTEATVRGAVEDIKDTLKGLQIIGKGSNGGSEVEKTQLTEDNGSKKLKPGQKDDKKEIEKRESDDLSRKIEIITSMLSQAHVFAVHRAWTGKLKDNLDIVKVMGSKQVRDTWGEANQALVLEALLNSEALHAFMTEHLLAVNDELLNSTLEECITQVAGSVGPSQTEEGQSYWILDNKTAVDLLFKGAPKKAKRVLVVHPKSGLVALEARRRYPDAVIVCQVFDDTFTDVLAQLGFQVAHYDECGTIKGMDFDFIVGNPPYKAGLHVKIIHRCIENLTDDGLCIMIHPSTPYLRPKKDSLRNNLQTLEFVQGKDIWPDVKLWVPLALATLGKNATDNFVFKNSNTLVYANDELTPFGTGGVIASLSAKLSSGKTLRDVAHRGQANCPKSSYYVMISGLCGNAQAHDMFFMIPQRAAIEEGVKTAPGKWHNFMFETRTEALNFCRFLTSKLAMAGLALKKINQHVEDVELSAIPWLDFSKHWTDEELYTHFNLTAEEIAFVESLPPHPRRSDTA